MSLCYGKRTHGCNCDKLPIDGNVIERVESLAEEQGQPLMRDGAPNFEHKPGHETQGAWDENLAERLAIELEAPLFEEPVAEDESPKLEGDEEQGMIINDDEEVRDENYD